MHSKRPSNKEICRRLEEAKKYLKIQDGIFANPSKAVGELNALGVGDTSELWELIIELLNEIIPKDYRGSRPPQKSYEKAIAGFELFAFSWWSEKLAKEMYIKFVLKNERFYYVSLHQSHRSGQHGE